MAMAKEIMGCSMKDFKSSTSSTFLSQNRVLIRPSSVNPSRIMRDSPLVHLRKNKKGAVAVISEDLVKIVPVFSAAEKPVKFKVRTVVTVRNKIKEDFKQALAKQLDALSDRIGQNVVLQLVSTEIDPKTKKVKKSSEGVLKDWSKKSNLKAERVNYTAEFEVDSNFGTPGVILVTNKHQTEFFLETITIEGFACGPLHFPCNSWMQPKKDHPEKRIVFCNKPYLPNQTPEGLKELRQKELNILRGDGTGVRKLCDRIYDYEVYNDLGNSDKGIDLARPTLGGRKDHILDDVALAVLQRILIC